MAKHYSLRKLLFEEPPGGYDIAQVINEPKREKIPLETLGLGVGGEGEEGYNNIKKVFEAATEEEKDYWGNWYHHANKHIKAMAEEYDLPEEIIAAVCAVLSPSMTWRVNVMSARRIIDNWEHASDPSWSERKWWDKIPAYKKNRQKALNILNTGMTHYVKGPKVTVFFHSLLDPKKISHDVVLDGHAINVWRGEKVPLTRLRSPGKAERAQMKKDYQEVAKDVGMTPQQVQAVTWFIWKSVYDPPPSPKMKFNLVPPEMKEARRHTPGYRKLIEEQNIPHKILKEDLGDIMARSGREYAPEITDEEIAKDQLQTAMMDAARNYFENLYEGEMSPADARFRANAKIVELEDLIVQAMYDFDTGLPGEDW